jgi:hypothetical protein
MINPVFMVGRPMVVVGGKRRPGKQMFHQSSGGKGASTCGVTASPECGRDIPTDIKQGSEERSREDLLLI